MAKKGKEFDIGGIRVQIDPFILVRRVLMRQKLLLTLVAIVGGAATIAMYLVTDKRYATSSTIAIRTDTMQEQTVRNLVNRAMRDVNSNVEMMLMINELNLFASTRAGLPYDIAIRSMRRELNIKRSTGSIGVSFASKQALECERVVSFASERVLEKIANLLEAPHTRKLADLERRATEIDPQAKEAQDKVLNFKAKYPKIALPRNLEFISQGSGGSSIQKSLEAAKKNLKACYANVSAPVVVKRKIPDGPECRSLKSVIARKNSLLSKFTASHPEVRKAQAAVGIQQSKCDRERERLQQAAGVVGRRPGQSQGQCIAAAKASIDRLNRQKAEILAKQGRKPKLQAKWAELNFKADQLNSELKYVNDQIRSTHRSRMSAITNFQENFQLVNPAKVPQLPSEPDRTKFMIIGMAITAILGLILATLIEALRQSYLSAEEFEEQTGLQVLATLPDIKTE